MKKLMLHACCGPCSLEPIRLLKNEGFDPVICWANNNIQPASEYDVRLSTIKTWAQNEGIEIIELPYESEAWEKTVAPFGFNREKRCRSCYTLRLSRTCELAQKLGIQYVSTTLAVSPYQLFDTCSEVLEKLAKAHGLTPVIRDYRDQYDIATKRSKDLGMYRQHYCGCRFSAAEAAIDKIKRRDEIKARKAQRHLSDNTNL